LVNHLALIGCGLIGSSIARAAKQFKAANKISVFDRDVNVRERARALKFADHVAETAAEAVDGADLVILCVPASAYADVLKSIAPVLKQGAIVSDTGSVKSSAAAILKKYLPPQVSIVPAHPVAGTEFSGPDAGFAELFHQRWCILTPDEAVPQAATEEVGAFWRALGANVDVMNAEHHDQVLAITSHIPHLIAYNIVGTADHLEQVTQREVIKYSAGGFRDFTRIASSDPVMWRDIFLNNKQAVLEMLSRFLDDLACLQKAIEHDDGEALHKHFAHTRAIRKEIIAAGQETKAPDFGRNPKPLQ
jgi:cyclohexadieny/prephenate dehydrogenase